MFSGSSLSMLFKARRVSDHLTLKSALLGALFAVAGTSLALFSPQAAYGRQTVETPKQTNERIQRLATLARSRQVDVPIGPGDLVHVNVFDVPELSRDLRVMETGDISFPLIRERIHVEGLTPFQLQSRMAQLLVENGLVTHPDVSVSMKEQTSQPVSVVGAVPRPMVYQVVRPTTLLELLAEAGGIADDAGPNVIVTRPRHPNQEMASAQPLSQPTHSANPPEPQVESVSDAAGSAGPSSSDQQPRSDPPNPSASTGAANSDAPPDPPAQDAEVITIHLQDLLDAPDSKYDMPIHGGDVVRVPKAGIIYVLGPGIAAPGGYILQGHGEDVTALKVVAIAHGWTNFAKPDSSVILRANPATGKREQIPVHLKKIEKNKTADVIVKTNDILYVPDSRGKKALAQGTTAAIGVGTGYALYRVAYY